MGLCWWLLIQNCTLKLQGWGASTAPRHTEHNSCMSAKHVSMCAAATMRPAAASTAALSTHSAIIALFCC